MNVLVAVVTSLLAAAPDAVVDDGQTWSPLGARTVAPGGNVVDVALGYPTLGVGYARGVLPGLQLGGRLAFAYGVQAIPREVAPGFEARVTVKARLHDSGRISLGVTFEPGIASYSTYLQGARLAIGLPVGLRLGIAASSALAIAVHVEAPMWIEPGPFGGFNAPILTGGGVEYFLTSELAAFARVRIGPMLRTLRPTELSFDAAVGLGYRF